MPVFYKGNMYLENEDYYIKLFFNKNWIYFKINLLKSDLKYIEKYSSWIKSNPILERKGKVFSLRYCFSKNIPLKKEDLENQIAIGVDLNVKNTSAVCSAINIDGTVLARKFINRGSEKDHLNKALQIKKVFKRNKQLQSYIMMNQIFTIIILIRNTTDLLIMQTKTMQSKLQGLL